MESMLRAWDGEEVIIRYDRPSEAWIFIAIHSTTLGPPVSGGTRLKSYPSPQDALQDALKLSAAMTYKLAVAGVPHGGGKVVIAAPPDLDPQARADLLRRYGTILQQLGGLFWTGPDVGTSPQDMDIIAETGAPYVFSRTPEAGGAGDSGPTTAVGVLSGLKVTCERLFGQPSLAGRRVLVQGTGSVGSALIDLLRQAGAEVLFSEIDPAAIHRFRDELGLPFVPPDEVFDTPCDIFSPCALGGILNPDTIPRLQCRAVAGAANNQLAHSDDAERLRQRQILYAPDLVLNIGGLMGIIGMESMGWSRDEACRRVNQSVDQTLRQVFDLAESAGINTHAAASRIAEERLAAGKSAETITRH